MNIAPFLLKVPGKWVVALNPYVLDAGGITGSRSHSAERTRTTAEGFWIEEDKRWLPQHGRSRKFDTAEEAQAFHQRELRPTSLDGKAVLGLSQRCLRFRSRLE
jgi:hypothetical protein